MCMLFTPNSLYLHDLFFAFIRKLINRKTNIKTNHLRIIDKKRTISLFLFCTAFFTTFHYNIRKYWKKTKSKLNKFAFHFCANENQLVMGVIIRRYHLK